MRKQFSFLLILLSTLCISLRVFAGTYTDPSNTYSLAYNAIGTDKASITGGTFLAGFNGTLTIPATITDNGVELRVVSIADQAFNKVTKTTLPIISALILNENLDTIGFKAFSKLEIGSVNIPATVSTIRYRAFDKCAALASVTFAENSKLTSLGDNVFSSSSITSLVLPNSLKNLVNYAFNETRTLQNITLPDQLESIGAFAFSGASTTEPHALSGTIILPKTVKTIGKNAFAYTKNLDAVVFPEESPVTAINIATFYESGIKTLNLPKGLTLIGDDAFYHCSNISIQELKLPASLQTIGKQAFAFWRKISQNPVLPATTKLVIPEDSKLHTIGYAAFRNGNWYGDLTLPDGITRIEDMTFLRNEQWEGNIKLPKNLQLIGEHAFECFGSFGEVVIPATVKTIRSQAFWASSINGLSFEKGSLLDSLGENAFKECYNLKYLDLSGITSLKASQASRDALSGSQYGGLPPYTVIYLPSKSTVAPNQINFVVDGTCDKFVVYDYDTKGRYHSIETFNLSHERIYVGEKYHITPNKPSPENFGVNRGCDYPIQHPFKATQAEYAARQFAATADKTYTLVLPFKTLVPEGMTAYQLNKINADKTYYIFHSIAGNEMNANEPYLLRVTNPSKSLTIAPVVDAEVIQTPTDGVLKQTTGAIEDNVSFIGTTSNILHADAANKGYYNLSSNIWYPIKHGEGTTWDGTTSAGEARANGYMGYVHSMRAYIKLSENAETLPARFMMMLDDLNETTAIEDIKQVEQSITNGNAKIYSTNGQYLGTDYESLQPGQIYIISGKKVYKY